MIVITSSLPSELFLFCCPTSSSRSSKNTSASILDDIGSMFDDLADQLDAMLD